jgi:hypothetical protein
MGWWHQHPPTQPHVYDLAQPILQKWLSLSYFTLLGTMFPLTCLATFISISKFFPTSGFPFHRKSSETQKDLFTYLSSITVKTSQGLRMQSNGRVLAYHMRGLGLISNTIKIK